jgi:hypothetical protein
MLAIFIVWGACMIWGIVYSVIYSRAQSILRSKGYAVGGFWANPFRDLRNFHHLVARETDSAAQIRYVRLERALRFTFSVLVVLFIIFMSVGVGAGILHASR